MKKRFQDYVNAKKMAIASVTGTAMTTLGFGHCSTITDPNTQTKSVMKAIFNALTIAGVVLLAVGVVTLVRIVISTAGGEQSQPGAIGKGIGMVIGGILLAAARSIVKTITGQDPTELSIF